MVSSGFKGQANSQSTVHWLLVYVYDILRVNISVSWVDLSISFEGLHLYHGIYVGIRLFSCERIHVCV